MGAALGYNRIMKAGARIRSIRLLRAPSADQPGVFAIVEKDRLSYYVFDEIACEIGGRGYAVHRLGLGDLYHVRIGAPEECSCECLGFLAHGRCKHVLALGALASKGLV